MTGVNITGAGNSNILLSDEEQADLDYRDAERVKIKCARRHFTTISDYTVTYDVINSYAALRDVIVK